MITPGGNRYEVVLQNKYYLRELVQEISLEESLDEIAYRSNIKMAITPDFPQIAPGQEIRVSGIEFDGTRMVYLLNPGVVWSCDSSNNGFKHINVTVYDRTIYLSKSEDEKLMAAGQTASQRLKQYADDWKIPIANIPDTQIPLGRAMYRPRSIYSMIQADLTETATKGGKLYRPRMTPAGLELFEIGSNKTVWVLDIEQNVESISQTRTLKDVVTQVKILGTEQNLSSSQDQEVPAPVIAIEPGEVAKYGTLQKILQNDKISTVAEARKAASSMLTGIQETFSVTAIDINTIRAGDKVILSGMELIVTSVRHDLGHPGHMTLELAGLEYVRRRYFMDGSF
jgi:hypothetical protein